MPCGLPQVELEPSRATGVNFIIGQDPAQVNQE